MNPNVTTAFDPLLVALSFAFAVIGSFVALTAAGRVNQRGGRQNAIGGGAVAVQIDNHGGAFVEIDVCYYAPHPPRGSRHTA